MTSSMLFLLLAVSAPAWADPAIRIGPRGGLEMRDAADPYVGVDARLAFSQSPLTINPTFDDVFDAKRTLYELDVNALYDLPIAVAPVVPYVGIGAVVTSFSDKQHVSDGDDNGVRLGMSLIAGACVDLPWIAPFAQLTRQIGEFSPWSFGGGVLVVLDRDARWTGCGRRVP